MTTSRLVFFVAAVFGGLFGFLAQSWWVVPAMLAAYIGGAASEAGDRAQWP